jgi:integrase/recombinase XerD
MASMDRRLDTLCSIYTTINKQRVRKDGTARLYIRITIKGDQKIPLPFYWPVRNYNINSRTIEPRMDNDPDYLTTLTIIETEKAKYWNVAKKLLLKDVNFDVPDIISGVYLAENGQYLCKWIDYKSRDLLVQEQIKETTQKNHKGSARQVLEYLGADIEINKIDAKWLGKYTVYLLKKMNYGGAWARIKDIKTYIRLAEKAGAVIHPNFDEHYLPKPESNPTWLSKDELQKLFTLYSSSGISTENYDCLRSFMFNCFCGLRISDLKRFNPSWIQDEEIVFTPVKQKITDTRLTVIRIPIIPVAKEFLSTLDGNLVKRSDQKYNERLKEIAKLAGIDKKLTTHVARHTFATQLAILNVPITVIAKLLGHKSLASTLIYIHIAEEIRKMEMSKLQDSFSSFTLKLA